MKQQEEKMREVFRQDGIRARNFVIIGDFSLIADWRPLPGCMHQSNNPYRFPLDIVH